MNRKITVFVLIHRKGCCSKQPSSSCLIMFLWMYVQQFYTVNSCRYLIDWSVTQSLLNLSGYTLASHIERGTTPPVFSFQVKPDEMVEPPSPPPCWIITSRNPDSKWAHGTVEGELTMSPCIVLQLQVAPPEWLFADVYLQHFYATSSESCLRWLGIKHTWGEA